jgi:hypothetical protein
VALERMVWVPGMSRGAGTDFGLGDGGMDDESLGEAPEFFGSDELGAPLAGGGGGWVPSALETLMAGAAGGGEDWSEPFERDGPVAFEVGLLLSPVSSVDASCADAEDELSLSLEVFFEPDFLLEEDCCCPISDDCAAGWGEDGLPLDSREVKTESSAGARAGTRRVDKWTAGTKPTQV